MPLPIRIYGEEEELIRKMSIKEDVSCAAIVNAMVAEMLRAYNEGKVKVESRGFKIKLYDAQVKHK